MCIFLVLFEFPFHQMENKYKQIEKNMSLSLRKQSTFGDGTTRFLARMTSEKQAQKFNTDHASLPRSG